MYIGITRTLHPFYQNCAHIFAIDIPTLTKSSCSAGFELVLPIAINLPYTSLIDTCRSKTLCAGNGCPVSEVKLQDTRDLQMSSVSAKPYGSVPDASDSVPILESPA